MRFTKILTKYSSEFNNYVFFQTMCSNLYVTKKELLLLFYYIMNHNEEETKHIYDWLELHGITELDINRMIKYINVLIEKL